MILILKWMLQLIGPLTLKSQIKTLFSTDIHRNSYPIFSNRFELISQKFHETNNCKWPVEEFICSLKRDFSSDLSKKNLNNRFLNFGFSYGIIKIEKNNSK